jgi:hypothetical protein
VLRSGRHASRVTTVPEPDDAPPQPTADFVAWMSTEMPDVAASGRRIQRRHQRGVATRPARWRSVRRFRATARAGRGDWSRWLVGAVVLALAGWGVVAIMHPFGLGLDSPSAPGAAGPKPTAVAVIDAFPADIAWADHSAHRVAGVIDVGCRPGPGVPDTLAGAVRSAGDCLVIQVVEYVDGAAHVRMAIAKISMADPAVTVILPLRLSEHLAGPSLLADPPATTIFASAAACSRTFGLVASAAATPGAKVDYQAMAIEAGGLLHQLVTAGCDPAVTGPK